MDLVLENFLELDLFKCHPEHELIGGFERVEIVQRIIWLVVQRNARVIFRNIHDFVCMLIKLHVPPFHLLLCVHVCSSVHKTESESESESKSEREQERARERESARARERETERERKRERERETEREREREREKERESESESESERERASDRKTERDSERERERVCVCERERERAHAHEINVCISCTSLGTLVLDLNTLSKVIVRIRTNELKCIAIGKRVRPHAHTHLNAIHIPRFALQDSLHAEPQY